MIFQKKGCLFTLSFYTYDPLYGRCRLVLQEYTPFWFHSCSVIASKTWMNLFSLLCFSIHLTAACAYLQRVFKIKGLKMGTSAQKCAFAPQFSPDNLIKVKNCIIITSDDSSILESSF